MRAKKQKSKTRHAPHAQLARRSARREEDTAKLATAQESGNADDIDKYQRRTVKVTREQFVDLCILLGCDYCDTIRGIGPVKAFDLIKEFGSIEKIIEKLDTTKFPLPEPFPYAEARELVRHCTLVRLHLSFFVFYDCEESVCFFKIIIIVVCLSKFLKPEVVDVTQVKVSFERNYSELNFYCYFFISLLLLLFLLVFAKNNYK